MAVPSAFALLCFALLCGLAASSAAQSKTETELKEGEAAGNQVLVEQALESRVVRGSMRKEKIRKECKKNPKSKRCKRQKTRARGTRTRGKPDQRTNPCKKDKKSEACKKLKDRKKQKRGKKEGPSRKQKKKEKKIANEEKKLARRQKKLARRQKARGRKNNNLGGGESSRASTVNLTCLTTANQLLNLTNLLDGCSAAIKDACTPPSGINQTFMKECFDKSKGFNTTLSGCVSTAMSGSDPCSCFTDAKLVGAMTNLKPCKGKDEAKLAAKARTKCLTQMRACNGYVEQAGRLQYTCKYTADDLKKTLGQITANNATVAAAMAKVKALTGVEASDGSSNSSRRAREAEVHEDNIAPMDAVQQLMSFQGRHLGKREIRTKRATYTCASMTTAVQTCTTAVSSTPSGSTVISSCTIETTQTSITCTDDEKTALQTVSNTLLVAQRIFTAFSISILSELTESAGATPSSSELESLVNEITTGTSTKAASSRNRNMLRQMVLDKMKN